MSPLARDFWLRAGLPFIAMSGVGYWFAQKLAAIQALQPFKVLNIIGLSFDLAGIAFLSHFVLRSERLRSLSIGPVAEYLILFLTAVPVGMMVSVHFGRAGPSTEIVETITYGAFMYIMLASTFFLGHFVASGESLVFRDPEQRVNSLGFFFLVGGVITQLFAAVQDMYKK